MTLVAESRPDITTATVPEKELSFELNSEERVSIIFGDKMLEFCKTWFNPEPEEEIIDWSSSSENIVEGTLKREHLLVKLQELEDSESSDSAECALKAIDSVLAEDDEVYLRWMQRAGTISIIQSALERDQARRPSSSVAAPLLHKLAKYQLSISQRTASQTYRSRLATYLLRRT